MVVGPWGGHHTLLACLSISIFATNGATSLYGVRTKVSVSCRGGLKTIVLAENIGTTSIGLFTNESTLGKSSVLTKRKKAEVARFGREYACRVSYSRTRCR